MKVQLARRTPGVWQRRRHVVAPAAFGAAPRHFPISSRDSVADCVREPCPAPCGNVAFS
jgi:hypothetical protein